MERRPDQIIADMIEDVMFSPAMPIIMVLIFLGFILAGCGAGTNTGRAGELDPKPIADLPVDICEMDPELGQKHLDLVGGYEIQIEEFCEI